MESVGLSLVERLLGASLPFAHRVRNVYLFGSRAHGLATPESDYDVMAVVESCCSSDDTPGSQVLEFEAYNLSITVFHLTFFRSLVHQNVVWVSTVLFLPKECVWREDVSVPFQLRKPCLRRVALGDVKQQRKRNKWKGDAKRGKKNYMHALRTLNYALQLAREQAISDLEAPNHHWQEISANPSTRWEDYKSRYRSLFRSLKDQLIALTEPLPMPDELNIDVSRDNTYSGLLMLHADHFKALDHPVVKECSSGLLIETTTAASASSSRDSTDPAKLVCYPPAKTTDIRQSHPEDAGMAELFHSDARHEGHRWRVFKMMISDKARFVSLYHYDGQWRVCSSELADCSDRVLRVRVPTSLERPRAQEGATEQGAGHWDYLAFKSTTHYNYWEIMEETLVKSRRAFANFVNNARRIDPVSQALESKVSDTSATRAEAGDKEKTLGDYFWSIWHDQGYQTPEDTDLCYTFMLSVAAIDACEHLSGHDTGQALLSGVRRLSTLEELPPDAVRDIAHSYGWPSLFDHPWEGYRAEQELPVDDKPEGTSTGKKGAKYAWPPVPPADHHSLFRVLQRESRALNPNLCSGFIVVDESLRRAKMISPQCAALARLRWFTGKEDALKELLLEIIRPNDHPVLLLPEWVPLYHDLSRQFHNLLRLLEEAYRPLLSLSRQEYVDGEKRYKFRRSLTHMATRGVLYNVRDHLCDLPISKPPANQRNIPACLMPLLLAHGQNDTAPAQE